MEVRQLYCGDNLKILQELIPTESVDLIYLDPPFNSGRDYKIGKATAFEDTWQWGSESEMLLEQMKFKRGDLALFLDFFVGSLGRNALSAYLVMMAARLVELHRVLKPTGSLYLHCDPTASHYLKVILDRIFGIKNFRNEIVWHYSGWNGRLKKTFNKRHDIILFYSKSSKSVFNSYTLPWQSEEEYIKVRKQKIHQDQDNRRYVLSDAGKGQRIKRYLDEAMKYGKPVDDTWDIPKINNSSDEDLVYPTQKPLALLERIIQASSNPGDIVLDPFCGCGTAVHAAERLERNWIGIDINPVAIELTRSRLKELLPCL